MKILIATDAWHPQVNGVVRTLTSLARSASALGAEISFLTPDGFPSMPLADLSGLAHRAAEPARDRAADRGGRAGCHPYRDRGADRLGGARLLPPPQARVYHVLYDALSRICRRPHRAPAQRRLCGDAALSCRVFHRHGRDRFAAAGTLRAGLSQARLLDARRRHRTVQPACIRRRSICRGRSS